MNGSFTNLLAAISNRFLRIASLSVGVGLLAIAVSGLVVTAVAIKVPHTIVSLIAFVCSSFLALGEIVAGLLLRDQKAFKLQSIFISVTAALLIIGGSDLALSSSIRVSWSPGPLTIIGIFAAYLLRRSYPGEISLALRRACISIVAAFAVVDVSLFFAVVYLFFERSRL